jgi:ribonuclease P protein component
MGSGLYVHGLTCRFRIDEQRWVGRLPRAQWRVVVPRKLGKAVQRNRIRRRYREAFRRVAVRLPVRTYWVFPQRGSLRVPFAEICCDVAGLVHLEVDGQREA